MKKSNQARGERTPPSLPVNVPGKKVLVWKAGLWTGRKTVAEALGRTHLAVLA